MKQYFTYTEKETGYLKSQDEKLAQLITATGHIYRDVNPDLYDALIDSIIGQQISTAAHNTIRKRIADRYVKLTKEKVNSLTDEELQSLGLSWRKVSYIRDITGKITSGELDTDALQKMDDERVIKELIQLKGVGRWTAEMVLTFSMQRPDVLSYGDLAIRRGIMKLYGLEELNEEQFHLLTDRFSPYRTTAALYFWHYANPACELVIE